MPCGKPKHDGSECQQPAGWGTDRDEGPCKYHGGDGDSGESVGSGGQRAPIGTGLDYDDAPFGRIRIERILDALEDGATYEIAARAAGISPRTFLRWRTQYPALDEKVQRAEAESATDALERLQQAAKNGDTATLRWLLEKRHGYDGSDGEVSEEDVRLLMDTVKGTIRRLLPDPEVGPDELISAIGDNLEEVDGVDAI